jgi:outer membrane receptor for monomeric catechols
MPAKMLRTIVVVVFFLSSTALAVASEHPRRAPASVRGADTLSRSSDTTKAHRRAPSLNQHAARSRAADHARHADPAALYKADRLSSSRGESPLDVPGQTTVLTRQVLDDMNATSLRDAMRSTAGVTVGR